MDIAEMDGQLPRLVECIVEAEPELAKASFKLVTQGWDSLVVEADDRLVFKFPRSEEGEHQLRREAALLALVARHVEMPIPQMAIVDGEMLFSRHAKIPGEHLLGAHYAELDPSVRDTLAEQVAGFFAGLHGIDVAAARAAGAEILEAWPDPGELLHKLRAYLDPAQLRIATRALDAWQALPCDPHGDRFGHFDVHGWNMAFDFAAGRLNGIYDFGDAGIGPVHQEFIYPSFVDPDLTARVIARYEQDTARPIDRRAVELHSGMLYLVELGEDGADPVNGDFIRANAMSWLDRPVARGL